MTLSDEMKHTITLLATTALITLAAPLQAKGLNASCQHDGEYELTVTALDVSLCFENDCEVMALSEITQQTNAGSGAPEMLITTVDGMDTVITKLDPETFLMFWKINDMDNPDDAPYYCTRK